MGGKKKTGNGQRQALYRKYRSRSLSEVVGQEHITTTLEKAIAAGKISHAYLFTGPRGTGKTSVARILAHELNQLPYTDDSTHLDIIEIDAASNRRIDDVRELRDKVHIAPISTRYKIYIIDEVHMLTTESFNALLKTLEEPPEHVIFILATTETHKLPATIISRTQRHSFRLVEKEKVIAHLSYIAKQEGITIEDDALKLLAEHGGGSFRDSISLLDQIGATGDTITTEVVASLLGLAPSTQMENILEAMEHHDTAKVLHEIEEVLASGVTPATFANQLTHHLRSQLQKNRAAQFIPLMHDLLEVSAAHYPRMKLEATLLSHTVNEEVSASANRPAPQAAQVSVVKTSTTLTKPALKEEQKGEHEKTPTSTKQLKEEVAQKPKKRSLQTEGDQQAILEKWPEILEAIREANNPLYTVLRLATPKLQDGDLQLLFQFPFHQKRVDETKYKSLLAATIAEVTGTEIKIICLVDKTPKTAPQNNAHASHLAAIQDIMGGGEIVHG